MKQSLNLPANHPKHRLPVFAWPNTKCFSIQPGQFANWACRRVQPEKHCRMQWNGFGKMDMLKKRKNTSHSARFPLLNSISFQINGPSQLTESRSDCGVGNMDWGSVTLKFD